MIVVLNRMDNIVTLDCEISVEIFEIDLNEVHLPCPVTINRCENHERMCLRGWIEFNRRICEFNSTITCCDDVNKIK